MDSGTVYSTEHGRICAGCGLPIERCECRSKQHAPPGSTVVRVGRQTKGRKGKGVTLVTGLPLDEEALRSLAKELKQRCGSGGTVKGGAIEVQGDHRALLMDELTRRGYSPKLSGS